MSVPSRVLCYHAIHDVSNFRQHLLTLKDKQVLLTVDDGDESFYRNAFPVLKELGVPAILFVITSLIDTHEPFWWSEISYYLGNQEGTRRIAWAKQIPNHERIAYLQQLRRESDKPRLTTAQLTMSQLKEMQENGVLIANHSHTHPMFNQCTLAEIRSELTHSKEFFERNGLNGYSYFAYPNGNWNEEAEQVLQEMGIEKAFLFDHKVNKPPHHPMRISRLSVNDDTPLWKLRFIFSGWHSRVVPVSRFLYRSK